MNMNSNGRVKAKVEENYKGESKNAWQVKSYYQTGKVVTKVFAVFIETNTHWSRVTRWQKADLEG